MGDSMSVKTTPAVVIPAAPTQPRPTTEAKPSTPAAGLPTTTTPTPTAPGDKVTVTPGATATPTQSNTLPAPFPDKPSTIGSGPTPSDERPPVSDEDRKIVNDARNELMTAYREHKVDARTASEANSLAGKMLEMGIKGEEIAFQLQLLAGAQTPADSQAVLQEMRKKASGGLDEASAAAIDKLMKNPGTIKMDKAQFKEFLAKAGINVDKLQVDLNLAFGSNSATLEVNSQMFGMWLKSMAIMQGGATDRAAYDARQAATNLGGLMGSMTNALIGKLAEIHQPGVTAPTAPDRPKPTTAPTPAPGTTAPSVTGTIDIGGTKLTTGSDGTALSVPSGKE